MNLLLIDGKGVATPYKRLLESNGHRCHLAKGPLRIQEVIHAERLDALILFQEMGRQDLLADLAILLKGRPGIRLLRILPPKGIQGAVPEDLGGMIDLGHHITPEELLTELENQMGGQKDRQRIKKTELAFRGVFDETLPSVAEPVLGAHDPASTSLTPSERQVLHLPAHFFGGKMGLLPKRWKNQANKFRSKLWP